MLTKCLGMLIKLALLPILLIMLSPVIAGTHVGHGAIHGAGILVLRSAHGIPPRDCAHCGWARRLPNALCCVRGCRRGGAAELLSS